MDESLSNKFFVGCAGDELVLMKPVPQRLAKDDALNLAAWLVALTFVDPEEFMKLLEAVRNT